MDEAKGRRERQRGSDEGWDGVEPVSSERGCRETGTMKYGSVRRRKARNERERERERCKKREMDEGREGRRLCNGKILKGWKY